MHELVLASDLRFREEPSPFSTYPHDDVETDRTGASSAVRSFTYRQGECTMGNGRGPMDSDAAMAERQERHAAENPPAADAAENTEQADIEPETAGSAFEDAPELYEDDEQDETGSENTEGAIIGSITQASALSTESTGQLPTAGDPCDPDTFDTTYPDAAGQGYRCSNEAADGESPKWVVVCDAP